MPFTPLSPLTVERIREVAERYSRAERRLRSAARKPVRLTLIPPVPDPARTRTAEEEGAIVRDWFRVMELLDVLSDDGVDREVARTAGVQTQLFGTEPAESVQAVLQSLDLLEPHFTVKVHDVRRLHAPETLQSAVAAAGARRTGDPRRPPLTEERIRLILPVLADYARRSPRIGYMLAEPMRLDEMGANARKVLGVRLSASADRDAGGAEGLVRDVFWMMLIRDRTGDGRDVDSWLEEFESTSTPAAWLGLGGGHSRKMKNIAASGAGASEEMVRLLRLVSREEEAAVVTCHGEIHALLRAVYGWA